MISRDELLLTYFSTEDKNALVLRKFIEDTVIQMAMDKMTNGVITDVPKTAYAINMVAEMAINEYDIHVEENANDQSHMDLYIRWAIDTKEDENAQKKTEEVKGEPIVEEGIANNEVAENHNIESINIDEVNELMRDKQFSQEDVINAVGIVYDVNSYIKNNFKEIFDSNTHDTDVAIENGETRTKDICLLAAQIFNQTIPDLKITNLSIVPDLSAQVLADGIVSAYTVFTVSILSEDSEAESNVTNIEDVIGKSVVSDEDLDNEENTETILVDEHTIPEPDPLTQYFEETLDENSTDQNDDYDYETVNLDGYARDIDSKVDPKIIEDIIRNREDVVDYKYKDNILTLKVRKKK